MRKNGSKLIIIACVLCGVISFSIFNDFGDKEVVRREDSISLNSLGVMGSDGKVSKVKINISNFDKDNKSAKSYKVKSKEYSKKEINQVVNKLKLNKAKYSGDNEIGVNTYSLDNGAYLSYSNDTGYMTYYSEKIANGKSDIPIKKKLSDKTYKQKAIEYISNLEIFNLEEYTDVSVLPSVFIEYYRDENSTETVTDVVRYEVTFTPSEIDGLELDGVGPGIKVSFDATGEVCDFIAVCREFEAIESIDYEMKNVNEVESAILNNENCVISEIYGDDNDIILNDVEIILYSDGANLVQEYAVPHYLFSGINEKTNEPVTVLIPAVKDKYINLK